MEKDEALGERLRQLLADAVASSPAEGILLSGGLDTSILAWLSVEARHPIRAITVSLDPSGLDSVELAEPSLGLKGRKDEILDLGYARLIAELLGLEHHVLIMGFPELLLAAQEVVKILGTFDPMEVRNSAAIYLGLREASRLGIRRVMTGDGADELFAGYSYVFTKPEAEIEEYIRYLNQVMRFSSLSLGRSLGVEVHMPYLQEPVRRFAVELPAAYKVGTHEGQTMGKWILRRAFEKDLPARIIWRTKTPIEYGSGSTVLGRIIEKQVGPEEYARRREFFLEADAVDIDSPEKLWLYEHYRKAFGPPGGQPGGEKRCPKCRGPVPTARNSYCGVCGAWPI